MVPICQEPTLATDSSRTDARVAIVRNRCFRKNQVCSILLPVAGRDGVGGSPAVPICGSPPLPTDRSSFFTAMPFLAPLVPGAAAPPGCCTNRGHDSCHIACGSPAQTWSKLTTLKEALVHPISETVFFACHCYPSQTADWKQLCNGWRLEHWQDSDSVLTF